MIQFVYKLTTLDKKNRSLNLVVTRNLFNRKILKPNLVENFSVESFKKVEKKKKRKRVMNGYILYKQHLFCSVKGPNGFLKIVLSMVRKERGREKGRVMVVTGH